MKKVLVCGARGMIGKLIVQSLLTDSQDYFIYAADTTSDNMIETRNARLHQIINSEIEALLDNTKIDILLQLAFPRNCLPTKWESGIRFSYDIIWLATVHGIDRIINVSSQSIYGWQRNNVADESSSLFLDSPYTTGKFCIELFADKVCKKGRYTSVRLSTIIGPNTNERVVNKFISKIVAGEDLVIQGGDQIFSFMDVRDAVNGLCTLIYNDSKAWKPVYNLGTSEYHTLNEIARIALEIGNNHGYCKSSSFIVGASIRLNNRMDTTGYQRDFGWSASYSLHSTIEHIFATNYLTK